MTLAHYCTACTLDGFIADEHQSLDWGQFDDAGLLDEVWLDASGLLGCRRAPPPA
jgi:hypothetical protein